LEDNIELNNMEIGWEGADWIRLAQERNRLRPLISIVTNLRVSQKAGKAGWVA